MKFEQFLKAYSDMPFIDSSTFAAYANPVDLRRQVNGWIKKGYLIVLKRGLYVFGEPYCKNRLSPLFLANFLVSPSYISGEYALSYHGFIPEKVTTITSVTAKKTRLFTNALGRFQYRSISKKLFFGFERVSFPEGNFFIALPEKALVDYFYLTKSAVPREDYFTESMRLQNIENLKIDFLLTLVDKYDDRVKALIMALIAYVKKEQGSK